MRFLARKIHGVDKPVWYGPAGWGPRADAVVFDSGEQAAQVINGDKPFEDGEPYYLEVYGGTM